MKQSLNLNPMDIKKYNYTKKIQFTRKDKCSGIVLLSDLI